MSTARGNVTKSRPPKYQNSFAFTHNNKSKKTEKILAMPNFYVCTKCHDQIEWKKKYRKYKPLTQPKKCVGCQQKTVDKAYHVLCDPCANERQVCGKCMQKKEIVENTIKTQSEMAEEDNELKMKLMLMSERKRRTYNRVVEAGEDPVEAAERILTGAKKEGDEDSDEEEEGDGDSDEEEEGDGDSDDIGDSEEDKKGE